jgi:FkbM family methyltransferase
MSKLVKNSGSVYCIEANPDFEQYIKSNALLSEFDNINIIMSAAGNKTGEIDLFVNTSNSGDNRVFSPDLILDQAWDEVLNVGDVVKVKIDKVDNLVGLNNVDIVLIDCQGWDHEVIRGMHQIIEKYKPKILTEFIPKWIKNLGEDPKEILQEYIDLGYNLLCPELEIYVHTEPEELLNLLYKNGPWFTNILLEPR